MGRSNETFGKKENEKNKIKKRKEKEEKKKERKAKGSSSFEDMIAYVDEYGRISSTPPDPDKKRDSISEEDIQIGVKRQEPGEVVSNIRTGIVTFFNDAKGYGFIRDSETQQSVFVHDKGLQQPIKERDKVSFETEKGHKGMNAINVTIVK
jgi:cold shock CspA family protein